MIALNWPSNLIDIFPQNQFIFSPREKLQYCKMIFNVEKKTTALNLLIFEHNKVITKILIRTSPNNLFCNVDVFNMNIPYSDQVHSCAD